MTHLSERGAPGRCPNLKNFDFKNKILRVKDFSSAGRSGRYNTMADVQARESRCIGLVVNAGMAIKFAMAKTGLEYVSSTREYKVSQAVS